MPVLCSQSLRNVSTFPRSKRNVQQRAEPMQFLSQELPSHSNRRARFNQTQLRGCFVDAIGLETTCAICIAPRWHSVVNLGDVDGRIERPMVSDQARDMSGADATTSVWPYDGPTPTHSLGPCFPVLPLRQNCARKNKPWGQPLEQNPTDVTYYYL